MSDSLVDGLRRALADHCTPEQVRRLEAGGPADLWKVVEPLGYEYAFVAEEHGGIGLSLAESFELGFALGVAGFPLPLLETAVARSLLAAAGQEQPIGPMVLCEAVARPDGSIALPETPGLRQAAFALARHEGHWHLLPVGEAAVAPGCYRPAISGTLERVARGTPRDRFAAPHSAAILMAPLQAAEMAGSMTAILDMTLTYAGDRRQFGRPIAQFQALQMEISALAEQVAFATMAARLGCAGALAAPDALRALNAKLSACDAAERVTAVAHAVHGAIGITEEYPLGMHARRLHEWRATGASASYCARSLGAALLGQPGQTLEFVRQHLACA